MTKEGAQALPAVVQGQKVKLFINRLVRSQYGEPLIEKMPIPVSIIATDLVTGDIASLATLPGAQVLDVGCGGGILAESMARRGAQVLGIDLSTKPLRVAQLHAMESGVAQLDYREVSVEQLADERPASFDVVTCMEMLEHVPDPASVVRACATLVRPGGWVFFSTINRNAKAFAFAIVGQSVLLGLVDAAVGSPLVVDVEESCWRAGWTVIAAIRNVPGPAYTSPTLAPIDADEAGEILDPVLIPLFSPETRRTAWRDAVSRGVHESAVPFKVK